MSAAEFKYTPLQDGRLIRLICLAPADESAPIRISIFGADLDKQPRYEALSYTWGSPGDTQSILCNEDGHTLQVTRNCELALRRLRWTEEERTLWIDAICIDQSNIPERGSQVQLMSAIYRQACQVIAYLGERSHNSDVGMDFILEDATSMMRNEGQRPSIGLGPDSQSSPQQRAIEDILARPYFQRCWIIQEVVFAKDLEILLGDRSVKWSDFSRTTFYLSMNKQMHLAKEALLKPPPVIFYRDKSADLLSSKPRNDMPQSLLELLRDTRRYMATDPRDKCYALLGISTERDEPALIPNYSLDTADVFLNFAKYLIERDKRLDVLCHVQEASSSFNIPTWVPDWTVFEHREVLGHKKDSVRPYKASSNRPAEAIFLHGSRTLVARGKIFDNVSKVGPEYCSSVSLKQWEDIVAASKLETEVNSTTKFMNTLVAYPPYSGPNAFGVFYPVWRRQALEGETLGSHETAQAAIFREQVDRACKGRSLFVTGKGFVGLGPVKNSVEYVVAVLLGSSVPFLLKREQSSYTVVGECYVYGLMNGEALQDESSDLQMLNII